MTLLFLSSLFLVCLPAILRLLSIRFNLFLLLLLVDRAIMTVAYYFYSSAFPSDANLYTSASFLSDSDYSASLGTPIIITINKILLTLGLNRESIYFLYFVAGLIGVLLLYRLLLSRKCLPLYTKLVLLLPSFSFWTTAPGKDSLVFLLLSIYFTSRLAERSPHSSPALRLSISLLLVFLLRPYVAACIIISEILIRPSFKLSIRSLLIASTLIALSILLVPTFSQYLGLDSISTSSVSSLSFRFSSLSDTQNPYPVRLFTYLLTPIPSPLNSALHFIELFQTLLLLPLIISFMASLFNPSILLRLRLQVYCISIVTILSFITYNSGISARQRWLVLPIMLLASSSKLFRSSSYD